MTSATKPGWAKIPRAAAIMKAGNSVDNETGSWRTFRPVWDEEKCVNCLTCWILCPDDSIIVEDSKVKGVDYDHCKGCGICASECPPKVQAYEMKRESDFRD